MTQIAVPAGLGMLFQTLFNVVDTFFAGLLSTQALTGLGASFPIFFVIIAVLVGLSQATTALMANALGAGDDDLARRVHAQARLLALAGGAAIALFGLFATAPLYRLMGVRGESLTMGQAYIVPILLSAVLFLLNGVTNAYLTSQGDARANRDALLMGTLLNVPFNALLMFGLGPLPGLGILGIALSTIVIQALQLVFLLHRQHRSPLAQGPAASAGLDTGVMAMLLRQAAPTVFTMMTTGIGLFAITYFMGRHGEPAVAAYGIALRLEQLAMLPMIGLTTAALTLVGQNNGARLFSRVRRIAASTLSIAALLMLVGGLVVWPLRPTLMGVFTGDAEVIALGAAYLGVAVLNFNAYALMIVGSAILQGLRRPFFAMAVGVFRHLLGPLVVLSLLDPVLGFGLPGIYWGIFGVAWLGALATMLYLMRQLEALGLDREPLAT